MEPTLYLHRFKVQSREKHELKTNVSAEANKDEATPGKATSGQTTPSPSQETNSPAATNSNETKGKTGSGPPQFDWVTERSSCTLPKVFNTLRLQVEEDVKTRNGLRPNPPAYEFLVTNDTGEFSVLLKAKELQKSVTFSLADPAILVRDDQGKQMFDVTLTFDDTGKCRLNVSGQERDFWQVRRMALEDLMYRGI
jgi:hypothetical protein